MEKLNNFKFSKKTNGSDLPLYSVNNVEIEENFVYKKEEREGEKAITKRQKKEFSSTSTDCICETPI